MPRRGTHLSNDTDRPGGPRLHRVLGLRDLVLLNIAAIVGLRWLSTAAQIGPASLVLWLLGLIVFFIPLGMAVLELSSRIPGEGGLYLWAKAAFGDAHGFVAGWTYWVANLVFFPSMLLFGAGVFVYVAGDRWLSLAGSASFNGACCLAALWGATLLNVFGLERAKWLQNIGGIATWVATALILLSGAVAWYRFGPATPLSPANVMPDFGSFATFSTLATIALAYAGLELGPIMGGEIRDARKVLPRAILISEIGITTIYVAGTAALLVALPKEQIDIIGGIPQALAAVGSRLGFPAFGPVTAALIVLANLGGLGAFVSGTARLPFVVGVDRYLPAPLAALHPKYGTPWVALLVQGTITSGILLAALSGATIHEAFVVLLDMTVILSLLPLLYIFAALPALRVRAAGRNEGITLVPGGSLGCWIAAAVGFTTTAFAIVVSAMPPDDSGDKTLFFLKVIGGSALLIAVGLVAFVRGRRRSHGPAVIEGQ
jgi:glutamate:GABA antiporter